MIIGTNNGSSESDALYLCQKYNSNDIDVNNDDSVSIFVVSTTLHCTMTCKTRRAEIRMCDSFTMVPVPKKREGAKQYISSIVDTEIFSCPHFQFLRPPSENVDEKFQSFKIQRGMNVLCVHDFDTIWTLFLLSSSSFSCTGMHAFTNEKC